MKDMKSKPGVIKPKYSGKKFANVLILLHHSIVLPTVFL